MAEERGFESLWVTERYFHEETFSMLGYLAAVTTNIRLGVGVVNAFSRNAALRAMGAATVDRVSDGRFMLGMGRSDESVIQRRMGILYGAPLATLERAVGTIRTLLSGETALERAAFEEIGLGLKPVQERLPIYLAAIGPRALRLAGRVADGVLLNAYTPASYVRWAVRQVREAAEEAGRDPGAIDVACMLVVRMTDDPDGLMPGLRGRMARLIAEPHVGEVLLERGGFDASVLAPVRERIAQGDERGAGELVREELVHACYLLGDADRCRARIQEYRDAGVDSPLLLPRLEDFAAVATALGPVGEG
jgi:5,10-methylenetetrahydromethanopterin reductase